MDKNVKKDNISHIYGLYYLSRDSMNLILRKKHVSKSVKTGEENIKYNIMGYYTTAKQLMIGIKRDCIKNKLFAEGHDKIMKELEQINALEEGVENSVQ